MTGLTLLLILALIGLSIFTFIKLDEAKQSIYNLKNELKETQFKAEKAVLESDKSKLEIESSFAEMKRDYEKALHAEYTEERKRVDEEIVKLRESRIKELDDYVENYRKNVDGKIADLDASFAAIEKNTENKVSDLVAMLEKWSVRQAAAVSSAEREDEIRNAATHHKISFNDQEGFELEQLDAAIKRLSNPIPFRKAVYEYYYKPKINELVLRVVGKSKVCGIYKITHIENGKTYVGQSVDIGNRWKQHAKRGCGADTLTQNKLYPALIEEGLDKFTWEIVEVVDKESLNDAEKYWQEYFKSKEFGYSMK